MAALEIATGLTSIKTALDITKAMIGLRDADAFRAKSIELHRLILESYEKAIAASEAQAVQARRVRELEEEVRSLKATQTELARYELKDLGSGAFAYMLKPSERGTEPAHWACTNCYKKGQISIIQNVRIMGHGVEWICPSCKATISPHAGVQWLG